MIFFVSFSASFRNMVAILIPGPTLKILPCTKVRLLNEASIDNLTKFRPVSLQKPTTRGRQPKYYHPLLVKEKHLESVVRRILPKEMADFVCQKGFRLAHLYSLPKTHKTTLAMRPILSASGTYNYALAKWLDE